MQVLQAYWEAPVPQPGEEFEFNPDASLQPIHYWRSARLHEAAPLECVHRAAIVAAENEAAEGLRVWTVANLCRSLSLDNILTLLTGKLTSLSPFSRHPRFTIPALPLAFAFSVRSGIVCPYGCIHGSRKSDSCAYQRMSMACEF